MSEDGREVFVAATVNFRRIIGATVVAGSLATALPRVASAADDLPAASPEGLELQKDCNRNQAGTRNRVIEWKIIARVSSKELYVIGLEDGSRLEGRLAETDATRQLLLQNDTQQQRFDMARIVWIDPLKLDANRIKRWDGSVSAGFDATKANSDKSLSASFDARRRELVKDLFVELSVYDSYDNKPPEDGTENDYGIVTSLGYSF
jgi:hypothetical protein